MKHDGAYKKCPKYIQNLVHTCCGDCHVKNDNQFVDPLLKLYVGIPVMITSNIDVAGKMANGTYGGFQKLVLKNSIDDPNNIMDKINIDGHYINCVDISHVRYVELEHDETGELIRVDPGSMCVLAQVPLPLPSKEVDHKTDRIYLHLKMKQLPLVAANAGPPGSFFIIHYWKTAF